MIICLNEIRSVKAGLALRGRGAGVTNDLKKPRNMKNEDLKKNKNKCLLFLF